MRNHISEHIESPNDDNHKGCQKKQNTTKSEHKISHKVALQWSVVLPCLRVAGGAIHPRIRGLGGCKLCGFIRRWGVVRAFIMMIGLVFGNGN